MLESPRNIVQICKECSDKRREEFQGKIKDLPLSDFIGNHVKKAFHGGERIEHMWVKISGVNEENGTLIGILDNDPIYAPGLCRSDEVIVRREEIEQAM